MTAAAVLVHGYHLGTDDAAIYAPGMKRAADPALYPFNSEFFVGHASFSLFPSLVGSTARIGRMSADGLQCVFRNDEVQVCRIPDGRLSNGLLIPAASVESRK